MDQDSWAKTLRPTTMTSTGEGARTIATRGLAFEEGAIKDRPELIQDV